MELKMEISQKQILSQRMIQTMEILQMSSVELEAYVENLSLENPVVELEESYDTAASDTAQADLQSKLDWLESTDRQNHIYYQQDRDTENLQDSWNVSAQEGEQLSDYLLSQLICTDYSAQDREIIEYLILSLDQRGYLTEDLTSIAERFHTGLKPIERLLLDVQALDPAGVGARDLTGTKSKVIKNPLNF